MAMLVISALGSAIGGLIAPGVVALGMTGSSLGWLAGSLIGASFAPTQKSEGPKLGDLQVSSSSYGTPIPYIQGHPRIAGQIVWASTKREIATTTRQGKGGGGSEYTSYTYEVDLLLELTDNPIVGVTRIWKDGKLVYNKLTGSTSGTITSSDASTLWTRLTVYTGSSTQLTDPTYEAAVGTANAPAYRGRGTVMIQGLQLGGSGVIPNLTFEVTTSATASQILSVNSSIASSTGPQKVSVNGNYAYVLNYSTSAVTAYNISNPAVMVALGSVGSLGNPGYMWLGNGDKIYVGSANSFAFQIIGLADPANPVSLGTKALPSTAQALSASGNYVYIGLYSGYLYIYDATNPAAIGSPVGTTTCMYNPLEMDVSGSYVYLVGSSSAVLQIINVSSPAAPTTSSTTALSGTGYDVIVVGSTAWVSVGNIGLQAWNVSNPASPSLTGTYTWAVSGTRIAIYGNVAYMVNGTTIRVVDITTPSSMALISSLTTATSLFDVAASSLGVFTAGNSGNTLNSYLVTNTLTLTEPTLSTVVSNLCLASGLTAGQIDVTGLISITTPVRALTVSQVSSARSVLGTLAQCYFFDAVLSDKIYFRPRGSASAATITFDELGNVVDGGTAPDPLALTQASELEIPAQMALTYNNVNGDYQTDTQYSDRLLTGQESTSVLQVPLAFTATEAKTIVDAMLQDGATGALRTVIHLGRQYAKLEPTDVITVTGADASTYRLRLVKKTDADGVLTFDAVVDDATVLVQAGTTSGGTATQTTVLAIAGTTLLVLDIPLLRDADDLPGHYIAVTGLAANWTHAGLYDSLDDVSYTINITLSEQAALGTCTTTLGTWAGGNVFDETNTVTVNVGLQQLVSVTRDELLGTTSVNAALIGSELVQYRTATLVSTGVYTLSGLLRGRRGTEAAQTGHAASETFVKLGTTGMRFITLQSSDLGKLRYYKAASAGQRLSAVTAKSLTPVGINQKPYSPVNARADRTTTDTVLTWTRRTRLSTRLVGTLGINAPLGETTESYAVEVWDSTYTTLKRTYTVSLPTVTYLSAEQVTDFGSNQATAYLRIYQISATVGRGSVYQTSA